MRLSAWRTGTRARTRSASVSSLHTLLPSFLLLPTLLFLAKLLELLFAFFRNLLPLLLQLFHLGRCLFHNSQWIIGDQPLRLSLLASRIFVAPDVLGGRRHGSVVRLRIPGFAHSALACSVGKAHSILILNLPSLRTSVSLRILVSFRMGSGLFVAEEIDVAGTVDDGCRARRVSCLLERIRGRRFGLLSCQAQLKVGVVFAWLLSLSSWTCGVRVSGLGLACG